MNEAETRAKLIDPALKRSGWGENQIEREHYFSKAYKVTAGRIYLVGDESRRRKPQYVDYLLRFHGHMIAVVEAKDIQHSVDAGLEQAKSYARQLQVPFAYSTNGKAFVEFDFFTNQVRELDIIPSPDELWQRWELNRNVYIAPWQTTIAAEPQKSSPYDQPAPPGQNPLLFPFCPPTVCGKSMRYYQEVAVRSVIERAMRGQKRILLTMATGTGKTHTAFQIVWKLKKSGWLKKPALFIADRVVLRDQAFNAFSPFVSESADPRTLIEHGTINRNRDLYFALYQSLDAEVKGAPLFKQLPSDFFGLIIIDECHRSGFGKWNDILQHFPEAIQLGLTATPKQDENIDTYAYFCEEEPEILIDPEEPERGTTKMPAFTYSLGQGIEDGFLATYKVHRVRTTVDKDGLHLEDARLQGAEIYVPADATLRDTYLTPQFEREISVPDRTEAMVKHLAKLLRLFGPMERTMVFCVDMEHARQVARLLHREFAHLGYDDYAVPIISEEGDAPTWLAQFQDSDRKTPVVATTAELLSTGVDVPSCRNIVFMKPIASRVLFKQIIGRGSRVDPVTGKDWFRIIDYVGATRLFDEWDRPPGQPPEIIEGPFTSTLEGTILHADTGQLLIGASVSVLIGPNQQRGPVRTDEDGRFSFEELPAGKMRLSVRAQGFRGRTITVETQPDEVQTVAIELRPDTGPVGRIRVQGLEVTIADEATFMVETTGEQLNLAQYLDYTKGEISGFVPSSLKLREVWVDPDKRRAFLDALQTASVHVEVLAEILEQPEADQFDLLNHIAFGKPVHTRSERAEAFLNREQRFMDDYAPGAREVILALLDKYRLAGVEEMASAQVFRLAPFREMGQAPGVAQRFGGVQPLRKAILEIQRRLYKSEGA